MLLEPNLHVLLALNIQVLLELNLHVLLDVLRFALSWRRESDKTHGQELNLLLLG